GEARNGKAGADAPAFFIGALSPFQGKGPRPIRSSLPCLRAMGALACPKRFGTAKRHLDAPEISQRLFPDPTRSGRDSDALFLRPARQRAQRRLEAARRSRRL